MAGGVRQHLRRAAALALAAVAAGCLAAPGTAQAAKRMEVALADDPVFLARAYYDRDRALQHARELGVTRLRVVVTWAAVLGKQGEAAEPPAQPAYYWGWYEQLIDAAAAAGIRVQLVIAPPAPAFATGDRQIGVTRPDPKLFGEFARAVATRFRGRVDRYSVWNEPNHDGWLKPLKEAPAIYRALYQSAYAAIKGVDRRALVLFGETAPYKGSRATAPLDFLRRTACVTRRYKVDSKCLAAAPEYARGPLRTDGYAHHPYDFKHPPSYRYRGADNVTVGTLSRLSSALDRLARARALATAKRRAPLLYLTEFGYFATGPRATAEKRRARYLPQAFAIAQRNPRVSQMLHYGLVGPPSTQSGSAFDFGLLTADGAQRPPYAPLAAWARQSMSKRRIAAPGGPISLPPAQPGADPPGEPPPPPPSLLPPIPLPF
ncbi:MAG TPA: hypothetical protein VF520_09740 [Thermoleophilaceae bacterium]